MQRLLVRILSWPFLALGFIWQFIDGSFYAGRIMSVNWIANVVRRELNPTPEQEPAKSRTGLGRGLH